MNRIVVSILFLLAVLQNLAPGEIRFIEDKNAVGIENSICQIAFDRQTGTLQSLANRATGDNYLKASSQGKGMPFRIYRDFTKEYELSDAPSAISGNILRPADCKLVEIRRENGLILVYHAQNLEITVQIVLKDDAGSSEWSLHIKNKGNTAETLMVSFPCLEGVSLGPDASTNLQTRSKGDSTVIPAWSEYDKPWETEYYLNMQWHAIWDPPTRNVLGLIFKDARALPKKLLLQNKDLELFYYPPAALSAGNSLSLPATEILIYKGSWRTAARAYRAWYTQNIPAAEPPDWFQKSTGWGGYHFACGSLFSDPGKFIMESFRDLAKTNIRVPFDNSEFAFHCQGSADYGTHTDGTNILRKDMGGAEALRDGIADVHRLGLHTTLYIEGYIVPDKSELIQSGKAKSWQIMHKDGTFTGAYEKSGFSHMCPGCKEWQDHLAQTAARLLRETGADGVRLDSLGYWYIPCYNPEHRHASPFDYNDWMKELLAKVRKAALEVNPSALLTTEAAMDWYGQWFHGSLIQRYSREVPPIRLAVSPYRPYVYAGGPVWGSLSGLAGGRSSGAIELDCLEKNWISARFGVHDTLVWGDIADDDPASSDPEIVTRCFQGGNQTVIITARPSCQTLEWPDNIGLSDKHTDYTVTADVFKKSVKEAILCDLQTLQWSPIPFQQQGNQIKLNLSTNWAMVIILEETGPALAGFTLPHSLHPGQSVEIPLDFLSGKNVKPPATIFATFEAPGLEITPAKIPLPGKITIHVPSGAYPGYYVVKLTGENLLGFQRFLKVE